MKQTILGSLFCLFTLILCAQPPNGNNLSPSVNTQNGLMETNSNIQPGYLFNGNVKVLNTMPVDSVQKTELNINQFSADSEDDKMFDARAVDQKLQTYDAFYLVRQKAKANRIQRTPLSVEQTEMDAKVKQLEQIAPHSWEHEYAFYAAENYDLDRGTSIEKAYELNSEEVEIQKQFFSYKYISGDTLASTDLLSNLSVNEVLNADVQMYTSDVLTSCAPNATLITHGFEDTYGCLLNQFNFSQATDVRVVSLDFMQSPQYREHLVELGYNLPKSTKIDVEYLGQFCKLNPQQALFLSLTIPRNYLEPLSKKLYPVGLTFQYTENADADLPERQEQLWFEQLNKYGLNEGEQRTKFALNYLPMLLYLEKKYETEGNDLLLQQIRQSKDELLGRSKNAGN